MKINGYEVLTSRRSWKAYCKRADYEAREPDEFPCIVGPSFVCRQVVGIEYITIGDINKMAGALVRATAQKRRRQIQHVDAATEPVQVDLIELITNDGRKSHEK